MPANNFDDLLRQRFREEEPEYNPAAWTRLAMKLAEKKKSPNRGLIALWPVTIGIAASITAAACMMMPAEYPQQQTPDPVQISITAFPAGAKSSAVATLLPLSPSSASPDSMAQQLYKAPVVSGTVTIISAPLLSEAQDTTLSTPGASADSGTASPVAVAASHAHTGFYAQQDNEADPAPAKRLVISLAGGMQYGSLNAGYAAVVNIRHDISKRWYVDADMGYVQYNASGAQQVTFLTNSGATTARPASATGAKASGTEPAPPVVAPDPAPEAPPVFRATQRPRIQYVQASPGVGYRVSGHFTLGASVDIQRALMVKVADGEPPVEDAFGKILPLTDLGASGRMQWHITERLRAGLTYRRGLNSTLQGKSTYLDRNYMQLQVIVPLTKK